MNSKATLSLKTARPTMRSTRSAASTPARKISDKKRPQTELKEAPMLLVDTWVWMTTNRESAAVRIEGEQRLITVFGSVEAGKKALASYKASKALTKEIVSKSKKSDVTPGAPPAPLIKTWLEMVSSRDSEEIRTAGKARLIGAFGSLDKAIAYIEKMPD
tara:strand:- start:55852 stop:56331 length:480 start_codon:yes stop_codon:yes gene_type:complete